MKKIQTETIINIIVDETHSASIQPEKPLNGDRWSTQKPQTQTQMVK